MAAIASGGARASGTITICLALLVLRPAQALEDLALEVRYGDAGFEVELTARLEAPLEAVEQVLRDYQAYPELDSRILEARTLERADTGDALLFTKLRACLGIFFCRTVRRVERVHERPRRLTATVIPERSDMISGVTRTILEPRGAETLVSYRSAFEPRFWVPALFGRRLMLRTLEQATVAVFENVERRARDLTAS